MKSRKLPLHVGAIRGYGPPFASSTYILLEVRESKTNPGTCSSVLAVECDRNGQTILGKESKCLSYFNGQRITTSEEFQKVE